MSEKINNPSMNDTEALLKKVKGGYKPTKQELSDHADNLKIIVARKEGIAPDDVDSFLRHKRTMRVRFGIGKNKRNQPCHCGSGKQHRKCCGKYSR